MTKENGEPTAAEEGKGKAVERDLSEGNKSDEASKDKDGKPLVNGKKGEELQDGQQSIPQWWRICLMFTQYRGAQRGGSTTQERAGDAGLEAEGTMICDCNRKLGLLISSTTRNLIVASTYLHSTPSRTSSRLRLRQ